MKIGIPRPGELIVEIATVIRDSRSLDDGQRRELAVELADMLQERVLGFGPSWQLRFWSRLRSSNPP